MTAVPLIARVLLICGHNFANNNVRDQLAQQQIFFPASGALPSHRRRSARISTGSAGQQLLTGPQAKAYADHFIGVHLSEVAGGKTYAQVSTAAQADPLTQPRSPARRCSRARPFGACLEAYAFSVMGSLAIASLRSLPSPGSAGARLLVFWHLRKVPEKAQVLAGRHSRTRSPRRPDYHGRCSRRPPRIRSPPPGGGRRRVRNASCLTVGDRVSDFNARIID